MELKVPSVGESVFEATVAKWHKQDGDSVAKDDLLCELETDKITLELNADAEGILRIKVPEGETVEIGAVIGSIEEKEEEEEAEGPERKEKEETPAEEKKAETGKAAAREQKHSEEKEKTEAKAPEPEKIEQKKGLAAEKKTSPVQEKPKPAGKETAEKPAAAEPESQEGERRQPMSRIRRRIAERLLAARQQTAMLTTFNEADLSRILELRRKHGAEFEARHGIKLGLMSFFVKATVEALREFPEVNAAIDGDDIVYHDYYNIGIAVGADKGLVVPVLKGAERLSFAGVEEAIRDFIDRVEENRIDLGDLEGGTFSITNGGVYGSLLSTPILNPPQSAILGMHAIQERPVARAGEIVIRPMMYLALSYDHRLIDGRQAVSFLKRIKEFIEEPEEMLLEL